MFVYSNKVMADNGWSLESFSCHACALNALLRLNEGWLERLPLDKYLWLEEDEANFQRFLGNVKKFLPGYEHPSYSPDINN